MKRLLPGVIALGLVSLGPSASQAQNARFGIGGGLTKPSGDYSSADQAGWHALGKLDLHIPMSPVSIRVDALYGQTSHQSSLDGKTKLAGGLASVVWNIPTRAPMMKPYLLVGAGAYNVKLTIPSLGVDDSETKLTFGGGAGVSLGAGPANFFVEGRYLTVRETGGSLNFFPFTVGVMFGSK